SRWFATAGRAAGRARSSCSRTRASRSASSRRATGSLGRMAVLEGKPAPAQQGTVVRAVELTRRFGEGDTAVEIAGEEITALNDGKLTRLRRRHIGFVFQFFNLLPMLTAEENVVLPLS